MTPARTTPPVGGRPKRSGDRPKSNGTQDPSAPRAKWVTKTELTTRREKNLCFRCGSSGHRIEGCPYRGAIRPAKVPVRVNTASFLPVLEESGTSSEDSDVEETGKA
jgi:hypothetical protein